MTVKQDRGLLDHNSRFILLFSGTMHTLVYNIAADWVSDSHSLAPLARYSEVPFVGHCKLGHEEVGSEGVMSISPAAFAGSGRAI